MRKISYTLIAFVTSFFLLNAVTAVAQTSVDQWGLVQEYKDPWPILNDESTPAGDASMGGEVVAAWKGLQGGFDAQTVTTESALVVKGKITFAGADAGTAYTPLRYALTYQDSTGLLYQYTDSAQWSGTGHHYGYGFHPRTGAGTMSNGNGGAGTVWTINDGNWASTWSNNGGPIAAVNQEPRNAELIAGTYDFAFSVHSIDDTTNEISWYLIEENNNYWFGGTVRDTATTKQFNSVLFGVNEVEHTAVSVTGVTYEMGDPITVPEAPWEGYYVDQWGLVQEYKDPWPILNDSTFLVGDGAMGGEVVSAWKGLQGGFGQDLNIYNDRALIIEGKIKFTGADAGTAYTPIRYALTFQDSTGLQYQGTDSAQWSGTGHHYGYGFHPRTGAGTMSNGNGGAGTVWTINDGNWASTWSNNGGPIAAVNQAPRNAEIIEGTYDFAISVHAIDDTTNEIRWYMIEEENSYWFGGVVQDTSTAKKFNSIIFGVNEVEYTRFDALEMYVDYGDPITVPEAPWEGYYVDQWGLVQEYKDPWPILNDSTFLVGDGAMGGEVVSAWKGLQGGFGQDVNISADRALIIEGKIKFTGADAGTAYTPIRYALTFQDSTGLQYQGTDSAQWSGTGHHYGYGFHPRTGAGTMSNGNGGAGTVWTINNGNWASTWSNNGGPISDAAQAPRNAEIIEGTYDFAISVHSVDETTNEIRWYMIEEENQYWFGGVVQDTATAKKFNSIIFGVNEVEYTRFDAMEMYVDLGDPIEVPKAPWEDYYVDSWGIIGSRGGWDFTPGEIVGNADFGGDAPNTGVASLRGEFDAISLDVGEAFVVEGKMQFVGGGFDAANSLRFGLFNGDAGSVTVNAEEDSNLVWTGDGDGQSGYLLLPQSGAADPVGWANGSDLGTWGAVSDAFWFQPTAAGNHAIGNTVQTPAEAVAGAGTYDFAIQVEPQDEGAADVTFTVWNSDKSYNWQAKATDSDAPTTTFNSVMFALASGNSTTAMNIKDVQVRLRNESIVNDVEEIAQQLLPTKFGLRNYPNPFNPTTTIEIALPQNSKVNLVVYDLMGREITQLAQDVNYNAGYHQITFDATNLASGLYFYRLEAGDYVNVKKLMLLK